MELASHYQPAAVESKWYKFWRDGGYFTPQFDPERPAFSMVLPPPNVTGVLHVGHALNHTWQDILVRYHRMLGDNTVWIPGSDHAGISTQMKVQELLRERGQDYRALGRDQFVAEAWKWKEQYGGEILSQVERLGDSVDWSRLRFTLEPDLSRAVADVFVALYQQDLIYRGDYITNWCVSCRTALSDIEVAHREQQGTLTYMRYPLVDGEGTVTVATTRPETMLGDTAVAVHPEDPRYRALIGRRVRVPLIDREIPIVADLAVDPEYGTGAVKVTPAHDPTDFAIGQRHDLPQIAVIDEDATMTDAAGSRYQGLSNLDARSRVVADLTAIGAIERIDPVVHAVGHCEKCDTVIEPLISRQWFVRTAPLAGPALAAVDRGVVQFAPARFAKVYRNWMENLHDWCISRQLWWGHRIPAYYCQCGEVLVQSSPPASCPKCGGELEQDPDVLDTWFSSALWPFSTLGWPDASEDMARYYPTAVLCTGWDIIPFWVSRMMMQAIHFTGEVPFRTVLINGLVRDSQGRKMSKSLGNGVDPKAMIDRYGADALRMALVLGSAPGNDSRFSEEKVEAGMHFANKVYNAMRFVLMSQTGAAAQTPAVSHPADQWIRSRLNRTIVQVSAAIEQFEFGEAARAIYDFFWDEFCDWYIELAKVRLRSQDAGQRSGAESTLLTVAAEALKLLHPFMPFVTEELWQALPQHSPTIMCDPWPTPSAVADPSAELAVASMIGLTRTVRNLRAELTLPPGQKIEVEVLADDVETLTRWQTMSAEFEFLIKASACTMDLSGNRPRPRRAIAGVTDGGLAFVHLDGVVDLDRERERLNKSAETSRRELEKTEARLADPSFVVKAPAAVVDSTGERAVELRAKLDRVAERLRDLQ